MKIIKRLNIIINIIANLLSHKTPFFINLYAVYINIIRFQMKCQYCIKIQMKNYKKRHKGTIE